MSNMLYLICVTVLAVSVTAHTPMKCCTSNKFEATLIEGGASMRMGTPTANDRTSTMYYDYDNKMLRIDSVEGSGNRTSTLLMYNQQMLYYIDGMGMCYKQMWNAPMTPSCIPDNATFAGHAAIGSPNHNIDTDTWMFKIGDAMMGTEMNIQMTVSSNDCTPVRQIVYATGSQDESTIQTVVYGDVTPGITDMNVFNMPMACKGV